MLGFDALAVLALAEADSGGIFVLSVTEANDTLEGIIVSPFELSATEAGDTVVSVLSQRGRLDQVRLMVRPGRQAIANPVRIKITFKDETGLYIDPGAVTLRVFSPSAVQTTYTFGEDDEIEQEDIGIYVGIITTDEAGRWRYRWETTGTNSISATDGDILADASPFFDTVPFPDYVN